MQSIGILSLLVLASMAACVRADFDLEDILPGLILGEAVGNNAGNCASYGTTCTANRRCCQYSFDPIREIKCFNGQCLQATCGYPGQECGLFIGDCCWHLNQECQWGFCRDRAVGK